MTLAAAITEIEGLLDAIPLTKHPDTRDATLLDSSNKIDGHYMVIPQAGGDPWPEAAAGTPGAWIVPLRIEVATYNKQQDQTARVTCTTRAQSVVEALQYTRMTNGQIWDFQEPTLEESDNVYVWVWMCRLRYQE